MSVKLDLRLNQFIHSSGWLFDELRWNTIYSGSHSVALCVNFCRRGIAGWGWSRRLLRWHLTVRILRRILRRGTIRRLLIAAITWGSSIGWHMLWLRNSLLRWEKAWPSTIHHCCIEAWFYGWITWNDSLQESHHVSQIWFLCWALWLWPAADVWQYYRILWSQVWLRLYHFHRNTHI